MDEPTSHLDFRNQAVVLKTVYRLACEKNLAIIMTTHLPYQALLYPTKAALMHQGRFLAYGQGEAVLTEENLSTIYHMGIRLKRLVDETTGERFTACMPVMDTV